MTRLTRYELRLFLRDPAAVIVTVLLPVGMVVFFGAIISPADGNDPIETFFPAAAIALGLAQLGMNLLPTTLVGYREKGILRRMATTPIPPSRVLGAQLLVGSLLAVVSMVSVVAVGTLGFGFDLPRRLPAFAVTFVLGVLVLFAAGLIIAAVAPNGRVASGAGVVLFFVSIVFGGVFTPAESMPAFMRTVGDYTPVGAFVQATRASWAGEWPQPQHLAAMAVTAVALALLSAKMFRWE
ncbi:transport permease protein [Microtetraspora sp. NBRC 13810]|uniref:ABC transporter permease n=1 Tax=Microtetraspora sp. NBRC 13810 TaxID=3030990 RepID=UPI0024A5A770|nr:ABC transporter permease [Microtetraspora sp. NBRC 13810]GLW06107.1 transport permease protein [Microtetraspora sp. NBRC 13810]